MKHYHGIATLIIFSTVLLLSACQNYTATPTPVAPTVAKATPNPKAAEINRQLSMQYLRRGDTVKAKEKLNLALKQDARSSRVLETAGYFYDKTGNHKAAQHYFQQAINIKPMNPSYHNNYGVYLCENKHYRAAIDQFLIAATNRGYTRADAAYENAGACAKAKKDPQLAALYFQEAIKINPKRANSLLEMAQIRYDRHQFRQAMQYWTQYNRVAKPTQRSSMLGMGIARQLGDKRFAKKAAKTVKQSPHKTATKTAAKTAQHTKKVS